MPFATQESRLKPASKSEGFKTRLSLSQITTKMIRRHQKASGVELLKAAASVDLSIDTLEPGAMYH